MHYFDAQTSKTDIRITKNNSNQEDTLVLKNDPIILEPKISIIVPVYQEEKIIAEHLKLFTSELRNKYSFELIVSDGGSTDNSSQIAVEYADKVIVHIAERRQTIGEGRNKGADMANGDILCFLNVDSEPLDLISFLELLIDFSEGKGKFSNYGALACYVSGFPNEVKLKDKIFYFLYNNYERTLNFLGFGIGRGECQIVRKDIFKKAGCYNPNIAAGEDFDLYRRISKISKVKFEKKLIIQESPRRFRKYGYLKTIFYWSVNALTVSWFGKSASKEWEAIR